jgi:phosphatidylglycerol lysyltransferase
MRQGDFSLLHDPGHRPVSIAAEAGQCLIMLAEPLHPDIAPEAAIAALRDAARHKYLAPCIYKCGARTARAAIQAGWWAVPVSDEAIVRPLDFALDVPARRQLRRLLRKAETAGVAVTEAGTCVPFEEMRSVARDWATHRGTPRGFSMGRFDADYVCSQRVWLARHEQRLIAFATMHESYQDHALDLMCHVAGSPPGTMHLLVTRAIEAARREGCPRVSLAAVPRMPPGLPLLPGPLAARVADATGAAGLARFKSSFAPEWEPLFLCAPGPVGLALAGIDLLDRIVRPRDMMTASSSSL